MAVATHMKGYVVKIIMSLTIATAAVIAAMSLYVSPSLAFGDAAWCASKTKVRARYIWTASIAPSKRAGQAQQLIAAFAI